MCHVTQFPARELAINCIDFIHKFNFFWTEHGEFNAIRTWDCIAIVFAICAIQVGNYRAMSPCFNRLREQCLTMHSQAKALRIVHKLLKL